MKINEWKMSFQDKKEIPCQVPCTMYGVLFENGYIPDPFYGTNELELRYLSEDDCDFFTEFDVSAEDFRKKHRELVFFGLDTICDITLNGKHLDRVMNMHRAHEYDVADWLVEGTNTLHLHFSSPVRYYREMNNKHYLYNTGDTIPGVAHLRKAYYMSGWDWGPTLPDMGIFRPVEFNAYDVDKLSDVMIRQYHEDGKVRLVFTAETKHGENGELSASIDGKTVILEGGKGEIVIENPRLWWPRGYGEQNLYEVTITFKKNGVTVDECKKTVGLRTLTLSTQKDEDGSEFCFVVNGVKIFAKGANYIPVDNLLSRVTPERIKRVIDDCCFANFNCIRVWGGAYYPEDFFYEFCDRAGLVIWQDFMVACANVWMRPDFEREITLEAIYNVKRIRHHASLGLLCGNNEMEDAICNWASQTNLKVKLDYLRLYEDILPELCEKYAPETYYLSSSPTSGGGFDEPQAPNRGDVHFWEVWNQGKPFEEYRKYKFRFCSEYGFESMPSIKTIDWFCPPEERNLLSFTMENHQKHRNGNAKFLNYLASMYQLPKTLEGLVYATQLNQAMAIQFGVEHFRRTRGYCMGSIYWQLNDCWPVSSWSSIDYFGRYKALHYFARKFYAPVAMGLFAEGNGITVNVANETMKEFKGSVKVGVMTADFGEIFSEAVEFGIGALSSADVKTFDFSIVKSARDRYFFADLYDEAGNFVTRRTELGTKPKHFKWQKPNIKTEAQKTDGGVTLTLASDVFAKNVEISFAHEDSVLSDNFFDIATKDAVEIFVKTSTEPEELLRDMQIRAVYDIPIK